MAGDPDKAELSGGLRFQGRLIKSPRRKESVVIPRIMKLMNVQIIGTQILQTNLQLVTVSPGIGRHAFTGDNYPIAPIGECGANLRLAVGIGPGGVIEIEAMVIGFM